MVKRRGLRSKRARELQNQRSLLVDAVVVFGIVVSLGLIAVSVALNFRMGLRSADTELDGKLYGAGAACGDCLKAIAPFMMSWGLRHGDVLSAAAAVALFGICTSFSFVSSLGFAAEHRSSKAGTAQAQVDGYGDVRKERKRIEDALAFQGPQRSVREVQDEIAFRLKQRVWAGGQAVGVLSDNCAVDRKSTRAACEEVAKLKVELAASNEVQRLTAALQHPSLQSREHVTPLTSDAQVDALAGVFGLVTDAVKKEHIGLALSILLACFIEVGSGVGLFMVTTPWRAKEVEAAKTLSVPKKVLGHVDTYMLARIEPGEDLLSVKVLHEDYARWCLSINAVAYTEAEFSKRLDVLAGEAGIATTTRAQRPYLVDVRLAGVAKGDMA